MPVTERNLIHGPRTESKLRTESESRIPAGACSPRPARSRRRACHGAAAPQANGRDAGWVARRGAAASGKNDGARWGWVGCVGVAGVGGAGGRAVRAGGQPVRGGPAGHGHVHGLGRPRRPAHPPAGNSSTLCVMKGGGGVDRPTLQQAAAFKLKWPFCPPFSKTSAHPPAGNRSPPAAGSRARRPCQPGPTRAGRAPWNQERPAAATAAGMAANERRPGTD